MEGKEHYYCEELIILMTTNIVPSHHLLPNPKPDLHTPYVKPLHLPYVPKHPTHVFPSLSIQAKTQQCVTSHTKTTSL